LLGFVPHPNLRGILAQSLCLGPHTWKLCFPSNHNGVGRQSFRILFGGVIMKAVTNAGLRGPKALQGLLPTNIGKKTSL